MTHKVLPSRYNEDYVLHWCYTPFEGKTILDLGADYGSTASFFLERGAKNVIAVEGIDCIFKELVKNYGDDPDVKCIECFVNSDDIKHLINYYKPDLVKSDIELAEIHILALDDSTIRQVPEYLIETHRYEDLFRFWKRFIDIGYSFKICWVQTSHSVADQEALVIYARRLSDGEKIPKIISDHGVLRILSPKEKLRTMYGIIN